MPEITLPKLDPDRPDFELKKIQMSMFNHPSKEWDLSAHSASIYTKNHQTQIQDISGTIYTTDDLPLILFSSPLAHLNNDHTLFDFEDTTWTHLGSTPKLNVESPKLRWDTTKQLISGDQNVRLRSSVYQMQAQRFKTSLDEDILYLSGQVKVKISLVP